MDQHLANVSNAHVRIRLARMDAARTVLDRAAHLDQSDRALVRSVFAAGMSASQIACACKREPQSIRRRLRRVLKRMNTDAFSFVVRNADYWPAPRREVARAVFLHGQSQRGAAKSLGLPLHAVRVELYRIRMLCEAQGLNHRGTEAQRRDLD